MSELSINDSSRDQKPGRGVWAGRFQDHGPFPFPAAAAGDSNCILGQLWGLGISHPIFLLHSGIHTLKCCLSVARRCRATGSNNWSGDVPVGPPWISCLYCLPSLLITEHMLRLSRSSPHCTRLLVSDVFCFSKFLQGFSKLNQISGGINSAVCSSGWSDNLPMISDTWAVVLLQDVVSNFVLAKIYLESMA